MPRAATAARTRQQQAVHRLLLAQCASKAKSPSHSNHTCVHPLQCGPALHGSVMLNYSAMETAQSQLECRLTKRDAGAATPAHPLHSAAA